MCIRDSCKGVHNRVEQLCDIAAAEMLLPRTFFRNDLASNPFGLSTVEALADRYQASIQATALRSVDLAATPAMLVVLEYGHKPAERGLEARRPPKLRVTWAHSAGRWPYPLRYKSVDEGSAIANAWNEPLASANANIDELLAEPVGHVELSAGRYGDKLLVLARHERS